MKLIFKFTLLFMFISLLVFAIGGVITYREIKQEISIEEQRVLREQLDHTLRIIQRRRPDQPWGRDKVQIVPLGPNSVETEVAFSDTLVMHAWLQRLEPHQKLDVVKEVDGLYYDITLYDLIIEEDDIVDGVKASLVKMYLLLMVVVLVLASLASVWLLKPFNQTLQVVRNFSLRSDKPLQFGQSTTREFRQLNQFLQEMTHKARSDYQSLKEFSENASHEMQTPLAIARGKLELLMESPDLSETQLAMVASAEQAVSKLSRLGRSLSLLTRIENKEFSNTSEVNLTGLVNSLLFSFEELLALKNISIETSLEEHVTLTIDKTLMDIMLTNLIQNAIRHNVSGGKIRITLSHQELEISNTGEPINVPAEQLFTRFKKGQQSGESIGLGLSIVKKICEVSGLGIHYRYHESWHTISVAL